MSPKPEKTLIHWNFYEEFPPSKCVDVDEQRRDVLSDKCEQYWLNGGEAYLHTKISSGYERWSLQTASILIGLKYIPRYHQMDVETSIWPKYKFLLFHRKLTVQLCLKTREKIFLLLF